MLHYVIKLSMQTV